LTTSIYLSIQTSVGYTVSCESSQGANIPWNVSSLCGHFSPRNETAGEQEVQIPFTLLLNGLVWIFWPSTLV